jgi:hypothetical protein
MNLTQGTEINQPSMFPSVSILIQGEGYNEF